MHRYLTIIAAMLCVSIPLAANAESSKAQYDDAHAEALSAQKQAAGIGNQWTTTGDALEAAETAAQSGDYERAVEQAERAEALAKLAVEQARHNEKTWRKALPEKPPASDSRPAKESSS